MWILLCSATKWHLIKGVFPIHNHCSQDPDQDNVVTEDCDWGYFFSTKHFASWNIIFYHMINWLQGLYGTSSRRDAIAIKWPPFHHQHQNSSKYIFFITNKCWPDLIWSPKLTAVAKCYGLLAKICVTFRMKLYHHPSSLSITSSSILKQQRIQRKKVWEADNPMAPFFGTTVSHNFSLSPCLYSDAGPPSVMLCSFSCFSFLPVNRGAGEGNMQLNVPTGQFRVSHLERTSDVMVSRALGEEWTDGKPEVFGVSWKPYLHKDNANTSWKQNIMAS